MLFSSKRHQPRQTARPEPRRAVRQNLSADQSRTFSYHAARSQNEYHLGREALPNRPPARRPSRKVQVLRSHARWFFAAVCLLIAVGFFLQLGTDPKIVPLTTNSDAPFLRDTGIYHDAAAGLLASSVTNHNKLTINAAAVAASLKAQFPELQDVSVTLPFFGRQPVIYIQPAAPVAVFAAQNGTFVVDENGRALIQADASTQLSRFHVPTVTDQSGAMARIGQQVMARSTTNFIQTITEQLQAQHIAVQALTLPRTAGELDVYVAGKTFFGKFNLNDETTDAALIQAGVYIAVYQKLAQEGVAPSQYIDVRLQGRAYYR